MNENNIESAGNINLLLNEPLPFEIYGSAFIEEGALDQMKTAMSLPVSAAGALMPDAHQGYGLPIGGVLATRNSIIPYGVGVDIGCRMALSVFNLPLEMLENNMAKLQREVIDCTRFGAGASWEKNKRASHAVLENEAFNQIPLLHTLKDKAWEQLGTSGGGNHFVELGVLRVHTPLPGNSLLPGNYLALLTHSGSRGLGATVASYYTKVAKSVCQLPAHAANLAYLSLDSEAGQEYWMAMNLAGEYASACHEVIHNRITKALETTVLAKVENHHNFAWKETHQGEELIVHRKGATPAAKDVLGFIPGSMTAPGFLVKGKGVPQSLASASHGAGRQMSRTQAKKNVSRDAMRNYLLEHGVKLIGGGTDEAPHAYKDIHAVMQAQSQLVEVLAEFTPKLVRMADDGSRED